MLPSRERLQALRTFANQATMALRAAVDLETLNARNSELAALHDTAVGAARADRTSTACSPRSCRAPARSSARPTGFSRSSTRDRQAAHGRQARLAGARSGLRSSAAARASRDASGRRADDGDRRLRRLGRACASFIRVGLPCDRGSAAPCRRRGRRRHRSRVRRAGQDLRPGAGRARRAFRPARRRSRSRTRGSTALCSRAKSSTGASSSARPI